jgi:hypothetical protein
MVISGSSVRLRFPIQLRTGNRKRETALTDLLGGVGLGLDSDGHGLAFGDLTRTAEGDEQCAEYGPTAKYSDA